jgi:hypothetical protein
MLQNTTVVIWLAAHFEPIRTPLPVIDLVQLNCFNTTTIRAAGAN